MNPQPVEVQEIGWRDMLAVTRMTFDNMIGADRSFTRMVRNPLGRWFTYWMMPLYLRFSGKGFKALVDGRLAGCAFLHIRHHSGYIFNVSVNRSFRRQGVARRLMAHLEQQIAHRNRHWAALQVDLGNEPAQQLYRRLGYRAYHPRFFRRGMQSPITRTIEGGITIERLRRRPGHDLYTRYLTIERRHGDYWSAAVVDDYKPVPHASGQYWRCLLFRSEIGCAQIIRRQGRPVVRLALDPDYWGHVATGSLAKELIDTLSRGQADVDLYVESSAHHRAAAPILQSLGFKERSRARLLMLKTLADADAGR